MKNRYKCARRNVNTKIFAAPRYVATPIALGGWYRRPMRLHRVSSNLHPVLAHRAMWGVEKKRHISYDRKSVPMEVIGKGRVFHVATVSCIVDERILIISRGVARLVLEIVHKSTLTSIGRRTTFFFNQPRSITVNFRSFANLLRGKKDGFSAES